VIAIRLTEMRAITSKLCCKRSIVIQQERDISRGGDGHKDVCGARDLVFAGVLEAQLQAGDIAGIERRGQGIAKAQRIEPLRGDEVKPAGGIRHDGRQSWG